MWFLTSLQQSDAHRGHLDDVFIVPDVACEYSGTLCGETTGVQLHNLLARLQDLKTEGNLLLTYKQMCPLYTWQ